MPIRVMHHGVVNEDVHCLNLLLPIITIKR